MPKTKPIKNPKNNRAPASVRSPLQITASNVFTKLIITTHPIYSYHREETYPQLTKKSTSCRSPNISRAEFVWGMMIQFWILFSVLLKTYNMNSKHVQFLPENICRNIQSINYISYYSIRVPGWVLKCLNLITAPGSVSNQPGSVTWLATAGI